MSADPAQSPLVLALLKESVADVVETYLTLVVQSPDRADVAALAIREHARAGNVEPAAIPVLTMCLDAAPNGLCVCHLAKALAAFGRAATEASPVLVEMMQPLTVKDDSEYWCLDGCVWALGFLGGQEAKLFLHQLASEKPNRVTRSQSLYEGEMPPAAREKAFTRALTEANALWAKDDPGMWRARAAGMVPKKPKGASKGAVKPWATRT